MKNSISTFAFLFFLPCSLIGQSEGTAVDPVETRELIRQWVAAERLVSEEKAAWQVEQKRMQELLGLYQKELQLLDKELGKSGGAADLIDNDKDKLEVRVKKYRAAQGLLAKTMVRLLPRAQQLIAFFPQPLQDELSADIDALNTSDALSKSRDVLRSMISILTTAERFNRSVTLVEETRALPSGKKISVDVIYLGLARAFYTARSGDVAGVGMPQKDAWSWQARPDIADNIRRVIAVYRKDQQPQLLRLPIAIDKEGSK